MLQRESGVITEVQDNPGPWTGPWNVPSPSASSVLFLLEFKVSALREEEEDREEVVEWVDDSVWVRVGIIFREYF